MSERNYFAHETIFAITKCYTKQIMKQTRKKASNVVKMTSKHLIRVIYFLQTKISLRKIL